jgi:hypothetical protein
MGTPCSLSQKHDKTMSSFVEGTSDGWGSSLEGSTRRLHLEDRIQVKCFGSYLPTPTPDNPDPAPRLVIGCSDNISRVSVQLPEVDIQSRRHSPIYGLQPTSQPIEPTV